ncbi:glycosyltransferase [Epibacterium sp. SM1969]|uniref:Glycosyltransferase n=1 Tax=Tritonibacter aquimaris TaxID=2663379 RepID=A0A844AW72_9RHOB|nr:glycosyltransferase [Tritonibacter aquimaris]MQY42241.1 glycosyltransferase [Tritonibacter aquimaris]
MKTMSILIPAHNEADEIAQCLDAVYRSNLPQDLRAEVLVLANGCSDQTAKIAREIPCPAGWDLNVLEIETGGKLNALNQGDRAAGGDILIYLDADVRISPDLLAELATLLDHTDPRYASGRPEVFCNTSAFSRAYGRLWVNLPFVTKGVPGFGVFAMNRTGRARWGDWPSIIADDTFARLMFSPHERHLAQAGYRWPLVSGLGNLIRVRRRQNAGVAEIEQKYPELLQNDDKSAPSRAEIVSLAVKKPLAFLAYAAVSLGVKTPLFRKGGYWARGR